MDLKYFTIDEFDSPDLEGSGENMDIEFLQMIDKAREIANVPFVINSGYRTAARNKKVGGKADSSHLIGKAADIKILGSRDRFLILKALIEVGFHRIGIGKTFIHVDNDMSKDKKVAWLYG